jgi:hypothetical protein
MAFFAWSRLLRQIAGVNPFDGDCVPARVRLLGFGRPSLPFPHLWNYREPIRILETFFHDADRETGTEDITVISMFSASRTCS